MSLDFEDFKGYLKSKRITTEYLECLKHRYGTDITIKEIWNKFKHEDILNSTITWAETGNEDDWENYHKEWKYHCANNIKPLSSKYKSIW